MVKEISLVKFVINQTNAGSSKVTPVENFVLPKPSSIESLRNRGLFFFALPGRFYLFSAPTNDRYENRDSSVQH